MEIPPPRELSEEERIELLRILQHRFFTYKARHPHLVWGKIHEKLTSQPQKLWTIYLMEHTGGEPDVIDYDVATNEYFFCDCSIETPKNRRNVCYDRSGQQEREKKGVYPRGNAIDIAHAMGMQLLTEMLYRKLQAVGSFDTKTSSWLETPETIRKLGGAIFGDRRYDTVFIYHNSAKSFYGVRGFRGYLYI